MFELVLRICTFIGAMTLSGMALLGIYGILLDIKCKWENRNYGAKTWFLNQYKKITRWYYIPDNDERGGIDTTSVIPVVVLGMVLYVLFYDALRHILGSYSFQELVTVGVVTVTLLIIVLGKIQE